ncbi:MAG: hypothetical protein H7A25_07960 [Leptospiraceae bacterium]|nr:hypothetical protein [Leptospiraceae bacterium]MCP5499820.1 hypothetical protein [Leptospiraceae bacterium]
MDSKLIKENFKSNSGVIASTFKREESEVEKAIEKMEGPKDRMFLAFLTELNLPLNTKNLIFLNSIANAEKQKQSFWSELWNGLFG